MRNFLLILVIGVVLVPSADASGLTYRTRFKAEDYLQHGLKRWAGVNLKSRKYKFHLAFCLDGARSRYEKKHKHFPRRTNAKGVYLYHTFACTLAAADRVWHLYLVARPDGTFGVRADT
jgi:hypothetical protein